VWFDLLEFVLNRHSIPIYLLTRRLRPVECLKTDTQYPQARSVGDVILGQV